MLAGRKLEEREVITVLYQVLNTLKYVHHQRIIHRDIKPSNLIYCGQNKRIYLIDFGAVKEVVSTRVINRAGETNVTVIGTRGYMPSEQAQGQAKFNSDIYALGAVCIQAFTGLPPSYLVDPQTGEFVWRERASVSSGLAAILERMTQFDFRSRYLTVDDVLSSLSALISAQNSDKQTQVVSPLGSGDLKSPFQKKEWIGVCFFSLILAGVVSWVLFQFFQPRLKPPDQPSPLGSTPTTNPSMQADPPSEPVPLDELKSVVGMDYTQLRDFLKSSNWRAADQETKKVLFQLAGQLGKDAVLAGDAKKIPCADLATIDKLWTRYSNGRFGFSTQMAIYTRAGGNLDSSKKTSDAISQKIWEVFSEQVGWKVKGRWKGKDFDFSLNAPQGHLPLRGIKYEPGFGGWYVEDLLPHARSCGIGGSPDQMN